MAITETRGSYTRKCPTCKYSNDEKATIPSGATGSITCTYSSGFLEIGGKQTIFVTYELNGLSTVEQTPIGSNCPGEIDENERWNAS